VTEVHIVVGVSLLLANLGAGIWGGVAWLQHRTPVGFWYALRVAQAVVVAQAGIGLIMVWLGDEADSDLHYVYGALPLLVSFLAEGARAGAAGQELGDIDFEALDEARQKEVALAIVRREMGMMAVACLVIFFLALRAAGTTPLL
jgi:heme A synthase